MKGEMPKNSGVGARAIQATRIICIKVLEKKEATGLKSFHPLEQSRNGEQ